MKSSSASISHQWFLVIFHVLFIGVLASHLPMILFFSYWMFVAQHFPSLWLGAVSLINVLLLSSFFLWESFGLLNSQFPMKLYVIFPSCLIHDFEFKGSMTLTVSREFYYMVSFIFFIFSLYSSIIWLLLVSSCVGNKWYVTIYNKTKKGRRGFDLHGAGFPWTYSHTPIFLRGRVIHSCLIFLAC